MIIRCLTGALNKKSKFISKDTTRWFGSETTRAATIHPRLFAPATSHIRHFVLGDILRSRGKLLGVNRRRWVIARRRVVNSMVQIFRYRLRRQFKEMDSESSCSSTTSSDSDSDDSSSDIDDISVEISMESDVSEENIDNELSGEFIRTMHTLSVYISMHSVPFVTNADILRRHSSQVILTNKLDTLLRSRSCTDGALVM